MILYSLNKINHLHKKYLLNHHLKDILILILYIVVLEILLFFLVFNFLKLKFKYMIFSLYTESYLISMIN